MLLSACGQHVEQRLGRSRRVSHQQPGNAARRLRARQRGRRLFPTELVAVIRDGLCCALQIVLRRKLCQHIQGLLVAIDAAEQIREFLDLAVLEQTNGLGAWSTIVLLPVPGVTVVPVTLVAEPVLTTLEGVCG
ncbi:Uncharacterised protein [Mycobacteroides abscessus subsp. abscessus]|nr:Uncharacterised protein [Mycobacteroides abscessus subsp. abscessus]